MPDAGKMTKQSIRIALAQVNLTVGDLAGNRDKIIAWIKKAEKEKADIISFPEMAITGYPAEDLLLKTQFIQDNIFELKNVVRQVGDIAAVIGFVDKKEKALYNAVAIVCRGKIREVYHKVFLPNYGVFDEKRYFESGKKFPVVKVGVNAIGFNICEDIWHANGPVKKQACQGARLIVNINASPYHMGKGLMRQKILQEQARTNHVFVSYVNLVGGQDELVFDGQSMVIDDRGRLIARAQAFKEELLITDISLKPTNKKMRIFLKDPCVDKPALAPLGIFKSKDTFEEVYEALVLGLRDYIGKNNFKKVVLGLSGGIDSSLVASLASDAIGPKNVIGVSMPSGFTSDASKEDAQKLAQNLGMEFKTVPIQGIFEKYLELFKEVFAGRSADITEENLQARIRGNIIMALSNKFGYLALNTGNKSEVSCGYCTLYGDMAGGFGVIKDVPKTLVYQLSAYKNKKDGREVIPQRVFDKAPTAELRPNQKDSDSLPEYDLLDKVLKLYVEEDKSVGEMAHSGIPESVALRVVKMVDSNEYKRRQAPPGIKITPKAFGKDRRMPITNWYR
jgi:NAD+ synthase (glutamine-hydrolysing)